MCTRRLYLMFVVLFSSVMLFGCSNATVESSNGYLQQSITNTITTAVEKTNGVNHTIVTEVTRTNVTNPTENTTNVEISTDKVTETTENCETAVITDEQVEVVPTVPEETSERTEYTNSELAIEYQNRIISDDTLVIKDCVIPLTYGCAAMQDILDNCEVLYDVDFISNENNTFLIGHNYKSFSILDSLHVGDQFAMNNHGVVTYYEIQKSGRALLNETKSDVTYVGEDEEIISNNYGYHGLILFTCDKQDEAHYRWVIVAKEIA